MREEALVAHLVEVCHAVLEACVVKERAAWPDAARFSAEHIVAEEVLLVDNQAVNEHHFLCGSHHALPFLQ